MAKRWKQRFVAIENTISEASGFEMSESIAARRKVVNTTFNALIRAAADDDAPQLEKKKRGAPPVTRPGRRPPLPPRPPRISPDNTGRR
ncbi:hypothetical protein DB30_03030 [Enhygromyxa salina]|uniref:Uncharacterized protein n=1 Tax=Enhygromyxa salina TaxID=215803 RepID=A0A0C1ZLJ3_9BACT|nr:hypothetical protein DB30_03030 [Enhygromyxa salina]